MNKVVESSMRFIWRFIIGYFITIGVIYGTQWTYFTYFDKFTEPDLIQPFPVLNEDKTVSLGGVLELEISFKKIDPIYVTSNRQIVCQDGDVIVLEISTVQLPVTDDFKTINIGVPIPDSSSVDTPQECVYQVRGMGEINPYRRYVVELVSEPFLLTESEQ